ncbi:MAG TPA: hypothetical protein VGF98_09565 [Candidatus Tumulicola sp.]
MRRISLCLALALMTFAFAAGVARANTMMQLSASHIAFYNDQFELEADGNVRVTTNDGFTVTGDAFSMDLKLNRFLVAGHVTLQYGNQRVSGAAISDFLDFNRIYFVPVTSEPDRWTFLNGDLTHPVKGRIMPGDVFAFPTLPKTPSIVAASATVGTRSFIHFSGATGYFAGVGVPLGSYVINFSPNQYFAQNSLTGANFDATFNVAGNNNSLSAVHVRYDTFNHAYLAFEQHFVGSHDYAIFSANPLTKTQRYFNFIGYEKLGSRFQVQTFSQLYIDQGIFFQALPSSETQTTYVNMTYAFPHSYLSLATNFTNYNTLGPGSFTNPAPVCTIPNPTKDNPSPKPVCVINPAGNLSHPTQAQLTWTSFQNQIFKRLPLFEQTYFSYGFNHDSVGQQYALPINIHGLQAFGGQCVFSKADGPVPCPTTYTTIYNQIVGFNFFLTSVKIGGDNPSKDYFFNATFNKQRQYNSLPHHIDSTTTTGSLSRQFSRQVNSYVSFQVQNTGDYYLQGGYQPCTFIQPNPPQPPVPCPSSLQSFTGVSTLRTWTLGINYDPNPDFNASLIARRHADFPIPEPNVFPLPSVNVLGQPLYNDYLGQPPYDVTGDVRFHLLPHMLVDIQRTYYFNFGNIRWSPAFIVQVLPQQ